MKYLFLLLPFLFFGCGTQERQSETKVVNGGETVSYKAVVSLKLLRNDGSIGLCTGTFIKHDLILTASHCVKDVENVEVNGVKAQRIVYNQYYDYTYDGLSQDFALIKFDKFMSRDTMQIATTHLYDGQSITMVGYGVNTYFPYRKGAYVKRMGFNNYYKNSYFDRGIIQFEGHQRTQTEQGTYNFASVGQGDSGGPLIAKGRIVGVASAQALYNDVNSSYYAYTVSDKFYDFMFRAMKKI